MSEQQEGDVVRAGMSESEMRERLVELVFGGDPKRLSEFCAAVAEAIPGHTAVVLRGSAVTGVRSGDWAPFDADGPGTSDLDLTLVGAEAVALYKLDGFFIPKVHSRPVNAKDPD